MLPFDFVAYGSGGCCCVRMTCGALHLHELRDTGGVCAVQGFSAWEGQEDQEDEMDFGDLEGFDDDDVGELYEPEGAQQQTETPRPAPQATGSTEDDIDSLLQGWQSER